MICYVVLCGVVSCCVMLCNVMLHTCNAVRIPVTTSDDVSDTDDDAGDDDDDDDDASRIHHVGRHHGNWKTGLASECRGSSAQSRLGRFGKLALEPAGLLVSQGLTMQNLSSYPSLMKTLLLLLLTLLLRRLLLFRVFILPMLTLQLGFLDGALSSGMQISRGFSHNSIME